MYLLTEVCMRRESAHPRIWLWRRERQASNLVAQRLPRTRLPAQRAGGHPFSWPRGGRNKRWHREEPHAVRIINILIFAMIAAFRVFRLRSVLVKPTGPERPPPGPYAPPLVPGPPRRDCVVEVTSGG